MIPPLVLHLPKRCGQLFHTDPFVNLCGRVANLAVYQEHHVVRFPYHEVMMPPFRFSNDPRLTLTVTMGFLKCCLKVQNLPGPLKN
jgi:hypothetical protein